MDALNVEGLCKKYRGFELTDVTFRLPVGSVMGFIGRNGSGKTTTIKTFMGLIRRSAGHVEVFGRHDLEDPDVREKIGFVYDEHGFYGGLTLRATGRATAPFYRRWDQARYDTLLGKFRLDPSSKTGELSRGQRTKLALALALSHDAELIVMDEPTSGLDPVFRSELIDILFELIQDERRSIFFSTHITADLEKIADFVTLIDGGRIVLSETVDSLRDRFRVVRGPSEGLSEHARGLCAGIRETPTSFEALSESAEELARMLGSRTVVEMASLDQIMVFLARGNGNA
jgi:ABC-2 type transport system ATP-binding protein